MVCFCPDDYVVATGETYSVRDFLNETWEVAGLGSPDYHLRINEKYFRPHEVPFLLGDATKARQKLGWKPDYNFNTLVKEMYDRDFADVVSKKGWK